MLSMILYGLFHGFEFLDAGFHDYSDHRLLSLSIKKEVQNTLPTPCRDLWGGGHHY